MSHDTQTLFASIPEELLKVRKYKLRPVRPQLDGPPEYVVDQRLVHLGSSPECDISLDHPTVSRVHCRIEADAVGHRLRDLQSKNGTYVNGVRVFDAYLPKDATIRIGALEFGFQWQDDSVEVPLSTQAKFGELIGESLQMREVFAILGRVAPTDATVLVEGESGTGKELVAQAVHDHSKRRGGPFVVFDCSAVPSELIESELFGHVKGSFTGATADRKGAFQEAAGGTLFIDEIGELSLDLQPKLLRALESREVKPVGSNRRFRTDARIVAATNRDLAKEVQQGNFREDLFYRLAVIRVRLPPLRRRTEDVPTLVAHFLSQLGAAGTASVSWQTMAKLQSYAWPGNVRELRNYIERAVLLSEAGQLETRLMRPDAVGLEPAEPPGAIRKPEPSASGHQDRRGLSVDFELPFKDAKARLVDAFERAYWVQLLEETGGNVSEAARRGGIHRKSLEYLLKKLDL